MPQATSLDEFAADHRRMLDALRALERLAPGQSGYWWIHEDRMLYDVLFDLSQDIGSAVEDGREAFVTGAIAGAWFIALRSQI